MKRINSMNVENHPTNAWWHAYVIRQHKPMATIASNTITRADLINLPDALNSNASAIWISEMLVFVGKELKKLSSKTQAGPQWCLSRYHIAFWLLNSRMIDIYVCPSMDPSFKPASSDFGLISDQIMFIWSLRSRLTSTIFGLKTYVHMSFILQGSCTLMSYLAPVLERLVSETSIALQSYNLAKQ